METVATKVNGEKLWVPTYDVEGSLIIMGFGVLSVLRHNG